MIHLERKDVRTKIFVTSLVVAGVLASAGSCDTQYWTSRVESEHPENGTVSLVIEGKQIFSGKTRLPYQFRSKTRVFHATLIATRPAGAKGQLTCTISGSAGQDKWILAQDQDAHKVSCIVNK
jgi:hypothetical protein